MGDLVNIFPVDFVRNAFGKLSDLRSIRQWSNSSLKDARDAYRLVEKEIEGNRLYLFLSALNKAKTRADFEEIISEQADEELLSVFSFGPVFYAPGKVGYDLKTSRFGHPNTLFWKLRSSHSLWKSLYASSLESMVMTVESFLLDYFEAPLFRVNVHVNVDNISVDKVKEWFRQNSAFKLPDDFLTAFSDLNARRNCFIHNDGVVNKRNSDNIQGFSLGQRLPLSLSYINSCLDKATEFVLDCLCFILERADDAAAFAWVNAEFIDIYYEIGTAEALLGFKRLANLDVPEKNVSFLAKLMNILCCRKIGLPFDSLVSEEVLTQIKSNSEFEIYLAIATGQYDEAKELVKNLEKPFVFNHSTRNPFLDDLKGHFPNWSSGRF